MPSCVLPPNLLLLLALTHVAQNVSPHHLGAARLWQWPDVNKILLTSGLGPSMGSGPDIINWQVTCCPQQQGLMAVSRYLGALVRRLNHPAPGGRLARAA